MVNSRGMWTVTDLRWAGFYVRTAGWFSLCISIAQAPVASSGRAFFVHFGLWVFRFFLSRTQQTEDGFVYHRPTAQVRGGEEDSRISEISALAGVVMKIMAVRLCNAPRPEISIYFSIFRVSPQRMPGGGAEPAIPLSR